MNRAVCIAVLLVSLISWSCQSTGAADQNNNSNAETDTAPQTLEAYKSEVQAILSHHQLVGVGIGLVEGDTISWMGGFGDANQAEEIPVTFRTHFRIGSVSKMFTALALIKLADEGKLSLQDRVRDLVPEAPISNAWAETDPVTVTHLLEHTAGFDDMHFRHFYQLDERANWTLSETIMALDVELTSRWRPGERSSYSNPGYGLAGYIVEKISGQSYATYIEENFFVPMGMKDTYMDFQRARQTMSIGYSPTRKPLDYRPILLAPAGDINSTIPDMTRFVQIITNHGLVDGVQVLPKRYFPIMEQPTSSAAARDGLDFGYALANYDTIRNGYWIQGHNGGIDGFLTSFGYIPNLDTGYIVMSNTSVGAGLRALTDTTIKYLTRDFTAAQPPAAVAANKAMEGYYRELNPRNEFMGAVERTLNVGHVTVDGPKATLQHPIANKKIEWLAMPDDRLRQEKQPFATAVFIADAKGGAVIDDRGDYYQKTTWAAAVLPIYLLVAAAIFMASTVIGAIVWFILWVSGRLEGKPHVLARWLPFIATLCFLPLLFLGAVDDIYVLTTMNGRTLAIMLTGIVFGAVSLWSLVEAVRTYPRVNKLLGTYTFFSALAVCTIAGFLLWAGLLGARTWAY